jgi:mono/diheme cytochrome c family protein
MSSFLRKGIAVLPLLLGATSLLSGQVADVPVDAAAASRGSALYAESCAKCHGATVRGTPSAPDLIRSKVVLHDRFEMLHGKELPPVLSKAPHQFNLTEAQLADLSQFLTLSINKILRSDYSNEPVNILTGNAKAGEAYFNGAGGCNKCHSTTGDMAGIGKRYTPANLQQKFLFPNSGRRPAGAQVARVQVKVTQPSGKSVTGTLARIDDFNVSLRETTGEYRTFERGDGVKVEIIDPFAGHIALLDKYTDTDIHNLLAYLVTLK